MERFVQAVYDHFELLPDEDNVITVDEYTFIFLGEQDDNLILLCPCFPLPREPHALIGLLELNCQGGIVYGVAEDTVVARTIIDPGSASIDMVNQFNAFITGILSARQFFGRG